MLKIIIKPRYNRKNKTDSKAEKLKVVSSSTLPSNIQNLKQKLLSGSGFVEYN